MQTTSSQIKSNFRALGILTKSHSAIDQNRLSDYLLQDQASKLLPHKFRVKYCLKRKIDKSKNRAVCWNESTQKLTLVMLFAVDLFGYVQFVQKNY
jgi:hypothetical protein